MFDFAWSELMLIAVVALVVIGPKDLPRVLKNVGFWVRKARGIAREFQGSIEQMVQEAELDDVKKSLDKATSFNIDHEIRKAVDPSGEIEHSIAAPELTDALNPPPPEAAPAEATPAAEIPPPDQPPEIAPEAPPPETVPAEPAAPAEKAAGKTP